MSEREIVNRLVEQSRDLFKGPRSPVRHPGDIRDPVLNNPPRHPGKSRDPHTLFSIRCVCLAETLVKAGRTGNCSYCLTLVTSLQVVIGGPQMKTERVHLCVLRFDSVFGEICSANASLRSLLWQL